MGFIFCLYLIDYLGGVLASPYSQVSSLVHQVVLVQHLGHQLQYCLAEDLVRLEISPNFTLRFTSVWTSYSSSWAFINSTEKRTLRLTHTWFGK